MPFMTDNFAVIDDMIDYFIVVDAFRDWLFY